MPRNQLSYSAGFVGGRQGGEVAAPKDTQSAEPAKKEPPQCISLIIKMCFASRFSSLPLPTAPIPTKTRLISAEPAHFPPFFF